MGARFITIEGGEGAGKSTQAARLARALEAAGEAVVATREPGGAPGAEAVRTLLVEGEPGRWDAMSETLLHFAARRDHLRRTVWPALAAGQWVVCDRFTDSTVAYQGHGHGLGAETVLDMDRLATGGFRPHLTLILDLPVAAGLERAGLRQGQETRYETMDTAFHERVRGGFRAVAEAEPERCAVIDATRDTDAVAAAVQAAVTDHLEKVL